MKGLTLSSFITLCILSWRFVEREYSSAIPSTELNQEFEAMPTHVEISPVEEIFGAFEPIPSSETTSVETAVTTIETEHDPSWADQWMTLPEHKHLLWSILGFLLLITVSVPILLMRYRRVVRVPSCKENDEEQDTIALRALGAIEAFVGKFEGRFGLSENYTDSEMMMTAEDESDVQFEVENDTVMTNMNAAHKIHSAAQKEEGLLTITEDDDHPTDYQKEDDSINAMKMKIEEERLPQLSIEMDSTKKMTEEQSKPHYQIQNEVDSMDTMRKIIDERGDRVQKEVNSVELIDEQEKQPVECRYELHPMVAFQHKFHQLQKGLCPLNEIEEDDEDFAGSRNELDSIKTVMMNGEDTDDAKIQKNAYLMDVSEDEGAEPSDSENEVDLIEKIMMQIGDELHGHIHNEADSLEDILKEIYKPRAEVQKDVFSIESLQGQDDRPSCSQNEMHSKKTRTVKAEDGRHAQAHNGMDLKKIIDRQRKGSAHSQNAVGSVKSIFFNVPDERLAGSLNKVGSVNSTKERLSSKHEERTAHDEVPVESLVRLERYKEPSKYPRAAGKSKKAEMKNVRAGLPPPQIHEALKAKVGSQSKTIPRHGEGQVSKTRPQKPDYSKVGAKVSTWRKATNRRNPSRE
jgi:hypothetical protein